MYFGTFLSLVKLTFTVDHVQIFISVLACVLIKHDKKAAGQLCTSCRNWLDCPLLCYPIGCTLNALFSLSLSLPSDKADIVPGYDFLVNSVWPEMMKGIEERLPFLYNPGNPDVFYEVRYACHMFISFNVLNVLNR